MTASSPRLTEKVVLDLLRQRHTAPGNGGNGEHAFLTHVRNAAGFDANRTFDAIAVNLWPSRGLAIHIFEVKISRTDWRRELAKPAKAEDAWREADKFSVVAPFEVVRPDELPPAWGLIEVLGDGDAKPWRLKERVPAAWLHDRTSLPRPVPRGLLVGLLRAAPGAIPGKVPRLNAAEREQVFNRALEQARREAEVTAARRSVDMSDQLDGLDTFRAALEAAGLSRWQTDPAALAQHAAAIAAVVRINLVQAQVAAVRARLGKALEELDEIAGQLESGAAQPPTAVSDSASRRSTRSSARISKLASTTASTASATSSS